MQESSKLEDMLQHEDKENGPTNVLTMKDSEPTSKKEEGHDFQEVMVAPSPNLDFTVKHPLHHRWTLWYDNPGKKTSQDKWAENLKQVVTFETVEDFWRLFNNIRPASKLISGSNYHLFKDDIEPKWEHPDNTRGGKWVATIKSKKDELDKMWLWTVLALIGENFDEADNICGGVVSIRKGSDRIGLWTKDSQNEIVQKRIGAFFKKVLELPATDVVGYQSHADCQKRGSSFNNRNRYEV